MHLDTVKFRNFRCFESLDLKLHPRLTVLVADNGGGKTSVLDGIAIGLAPVLKYLSTANQRLKGPGFKDTDFRLIEQEAVTRDGCFSASDYVQVIVDTTSNLRWDVWSPAQAGKQPEIKIGQASLSTFTEDLLDSLKTAEPKLLPVFAYYGAKRGWIIVPDRLHTLKSDFSHSTSALVGSLDAMSDFKEMLKWFDEMEVAELRANEGIMRKNWIEHPVLSEVRETLVTLLRGAFGNPHFNYKHKFVVQAGHKRKHSGIILNVSQLSQGYQSMLALGMDFTRRLVLANPSDSARRLALAHTLDPEDASSVQDFFTGPCYAPAIMLVDEIDLHLHPKWQQRVLGDLMEAFPGTQFIVTTHSPQVLTTVGKENIRILEQDKEGRWTAREPEHSPLARESGDALAYVMDVDPKPKQSVGQNELLDDIHEYELLIRAGKKDAADTVALKARLDAAGYEIPQADLALWNFLASKRQAEVFGKSLPRSGSRKILLDEEP